MLTTCSSVYQCRTATLYKGRRYRQRRLDADISDPGPAHWERG